PNTINPLIIQADPSNDPSLADYDVGGGGQFVQGNYDISLTIDPTNPNVVYLGGTADGQATGLIRVDTTGIADPYAFYLGQNGNDGGAITANTTSPFELAKKDEFPVTGFFPTVIDARTSPTLNKIHDPFNPFDTATFYTFNGANFTNTGANVRWIP